MNKDFNLEMGGEEIPCGTGVGGAQEKIRIRTIVLAMQGTST